MLQDSNTRVRSCILRVELKHEDINNLNYHRRNYTKVKQKIIWFIYKFYALGYRHFILYITCNIDFWLAEILYFMSSCKQGLNLSYSLYLWAEEAGQNQAWMDEEYYLEDVIRGARRVYWRHETWHVYNCDIMVIDLVAYLYSVYSSAKPTLLYEIKKA